MYLDHFGLREAPFLITPHADFFYGGANRSEMDRHLYGLAHLVLLPFRDSHEDIRTVQQDLETFPRALASPTQWPTNPWACEAADKLIESQLGQYRTRILEPVF
ncbi:hypothetical protein PDK10_27680, partial [Bacillus cereus]|nr:hypothetical protein [Bacillus cereus]